MSGPKPAAGSSRVAQVGDAPEVAALLDRFNAEFDEFTPGTEVLEPRVREHIGRDERDFLLAGPAKAGVAQLHFREYLHTGKLICCVESSTWCRPGAARATDGR